MISFLVWVLTAIPLFLLAIHYVWRWLARPENPLPYLLGAGQCALISWVAYGWVSAFGGPYQPAIVVLCWEWTTLAALLIYELRQVCPFDGALSFLGGRFCPPPPGRHKG